MSTLVDGHLSYMQQVLGEQWQKLPEALQTHYTNDEQGMNAAEGFLTIDYPWWMQWPLNGLRLCGALVNRRGSKLRTRVVSQMEAHKSGQSKQYWHRTIEFPDGKKIHFKSHFTLQKKRNELIEFTSPLVGISVKLHVDEQERLHYESNAYVLKLGKYLIPFPDRWLLGRAFIVETANSDGSFDMNFRLEHAMLGEVFSYRGCFLTSHDSKEKVQHT
jgi:hypothetical protein